MKTFESRLAVYEYILKHNNGTKSTEDMALAMKVKKETVYACMQTLRQKGVKMNIRRNSLPNSIDALIRKYAKINS